MIGILLTIGVIICFIMYFKNKYKCYHKWKSHNKKSYRESHVAYKGFKDVTYETLICEKCGKIEKLES